MCKAGGWWINMGITLFCFLVFLFSSRIFPPLVPSLRLLSMGVSAGHYRRKPAMVESCRPAGELTYYTDAIFATCIDTADLSDFHVNRTKDIWNVLVERRIILNHKSKVSSAERKRNVGTVNTTKAGLSVRKSGFVWLYKETLCLNVIQKEREERKRGRRTDRRTDK